MRPRSQLDLADLAVMRPSPHLMRSVLVECKPLELDDQDSRESEEEALALRGDGHALESEPEGLRGGG